MPTTTFSFWKIPPLVCFDKKIFNGSKLTGEWPFHRALRAHHKSRPSLPKMSPFPNDRGPPIIPRTGLLPHKRSHYSFFLLNTLRVGFFNLLQISFFNTNQIVISLNFSYEQNLCFTFYNNKYKTLLKRRVYQTVLHGIPFFGDVNFISSRVKFISTRVKGGDSKIQ